MRTGKSVEKLGVLARKAWGRPRRGGHADVFHSWCLQLVEPTGRRDDRPPSAAAAWVYRPRLLPQLLPELPGQFRGLSSIRAPFPSCGFVQRRLWVGALEIFGGLSTSIGCLAILKHGGIAEGSSLARREAGSKENFYGRW